MPAIMSAARTASAMCLRRRGLVWTTDSLAPISLGTLAFASLTSSSANVDCASARGPARSLTTLDRTALT